MALQISKIFAKNEAGETVELDASALIYMLLSSKGNIQISSPKNLNLEPIKNTKIKNGSGGQTELVADNTGDVDENVLKSVVSVDKDGNPLDSDLTIDLKLNLADLILNNKDAADISSISIKFMTGKKTSKKYVEGKLKGKSIECRAICDSAPGTGGGVAAQFTSCDSHLQENAWKVESGRLKDVEEGEPASAEQWNEFYGKEGGMGIEIIRVNSQYNSQYSRTYRQKGDAPMYGVTRGSLVTTYEEDGTTIKKVDYPKQSDGSQDIIPAEQIADPLTMNKLYALYRWAKAQGFSL